jgi:mRNA-degrading endonuclease RelE of RelBE toxin-antitoxin system
MTTNYFRYDISDRLQETFKKIYKKDNQLYEAIFKKIDEISSRDDITIDFYKNLRYDLSEYKRVHIKKSFVLIFKVFKKDRYILFDKISHHDDIYKK